MKKRKFLQPAVGTAAPAMGWRAAMKSLEMIHAIFAAGLARGRAELPLQNRRHPLAG